MSDSESATTASSILTESTTAATENATGTAGSENAQEFINQIPSISIKTPLIYLGVLIFTLIIFSIYYRRNKIKSLEKLTSESLFDPAFKIDENISNISNIPTIDSISAIIFNDLTELKVHEKLLITSLIQRTAESIRRIVKLKEIEPSIMMLYSRGLIGDDSFKRFQLQSKLQDAEMKEIAQQAENYKQGLSRLIFPNAQEVMMNQAFRRRISAVDSRYQSMHDLEISGVENIIDDIQKRVVELK